jgi:hypothetical protein
MHTIELDKGSVRTKTTSTSKDTAAVAGYYLKRENSFKYENEKDSMHLSVRSKI